MKKIRNKIILLSAIILLIAPALPCYALSLSQIRDQIRTAIKDQDSSRRRYSDATINSLINETQRDVVNISWIIKKSTDIELTTGTTYYSYPADIIEIHRVTFQHKNIPETSLQELDSQFNNGAWATIAGTPTRYFQNPSEPDSIGVYPFPGTSASTGTLRIIYFSEPVDLSGDSDVPFNEIERYAQFHDLLIYEPCYKIFLMEAEYDRAAAHKAYYEARMQILLGTVGQRPNFLPGFSSQRK